MKVNNKNKSKQKDSLNLNSITKYITTVFGTDNQKDKQNPKKLNTVCNTIRRSLPGFFTPYDSFRGFALGLVSPIVMPLVFSLISAAAVVIFAVAALTTIGSLIITGGCAFVSLFNKNTKECLESSATFSMVCAIITALASLAKIASLIIATVLFPLTVALLITRSAASLISLVNDCCSNNNCQDSDVEDESLIEMSDTICPVAN